MSVMVYFSAVQATVEYFLCLLEGTFSGKVCPHLLFRTMVFLHTRWLFIFHSLQSSVELKHLVRPQFLL